MTKTKRLLLVSCLSISGFSTAQGFTLSSPTIKANSILTDAQVFNGFGCTGKNISPALTWKTHQKPPKVTP